MTGTLLPQLNRQAQLQPSRCISIRRGTPARCTRQACVSQHDREMPCCTSASLSIRRCDYRAPTRGCIEKSYTAAALVYCRCDTAWPLHAIWRATLIVAACLACCFTDQLCRRCSRDPPAVPFSSWILGPSRHGPLARCSTLKKTPTCVIYTVDCKPEARPKQSGSALVTRCWPWQRLCALTASTAALGTTGSCGTPHLPIADLTLPSRNLQRSHIACVCCSRSRQPASGGTLLTRLPQQLPQLEALPAPKPARQPARSSCTALELAWLL